MAGLFNSPLVTLAHKSLNFRTQRHDVLASNIANIDTPGYKAEDLVFEKALNKALHADKPGPLQTTDARHLDGNQTPSLNLVEAKRINSATPFVKFNGNTVDLDKEMAKLAENQMMYTAAIRMLQHQFRLMKTAVSEGR